MTNLSRNILQAILLSLATGLVQAQGMSPTVYGIMDVTVRHASNATSSNSVGDGLYGGSRLGFKGGEDLGGGLRTSYVLEMGMDPSSGALQQATPSANYGQTAASAGRAFGRESWIGIGASHWGQLTLGRQYTLAHQAAGRVQAMGNPNLDAITVLSNHHLARQDNLLKYTKDLGPVSLAASVTLGEGSGRASGLSATYSAGDLEAVLYGQDLAAATGGEVRKIRGAGAAYQIAPGWKAFGAHMQRSHEVSRQRNQVTTLGVNYQASPTLILTGSASSDRQSAFGSTAAGTRRVVWVSADYYLSKRTDIYVAVDHNKIDGGYVQPAFMLVRGAQTGVTAGMRHRF